MKDIRTTVPLSPEVHDLFTELAAIQRIPLGRAIAGWLDDSKDAAMFAVMQMRKAKAEPARVIRELHAMAEGAVTMADGLMVELRDAEKRSSPPSCNTGGHLSTTTPKKPSSPVKRSRAKP